MALNKLKSRFLTKQCKNKVASIKNSQERQLESDNVTATKLIKLPNNNNSIIKMNPCNLKLKNTQKVLNKVKDNSVEGSRNS